MYCPGCKLGGRKDNNCTHMSCTACHTVWCYICGLEEKKLDKSDPKGDIYRHNEDWDTNPKRCPMYFNEIHDIDASWPEDDEDCIILFHRKRTLELL